MQSIMKYVRHVAARTARNAKQGNIPVTILFFRSVSPPDQLLDKLTCMHRKNYFTPNYLPHTRCSCLIVLLRALSGAGFNPGDLAGSQSQHGSPSENLPLTGWRAMSQRRLEKEWARLSNSGMLIWEDVVRREKAWQQNWISPAMEVLHNRRVRYLGAVVGEGDERNEVDDLVIGDEDEVPMDEDDDLFAPEHEYIERPLPVLNKKIGSTSTSTNVASAIVGDMKAGAPPRKKRQLDSA
jgi:hypothetical protein